MPAAALVVARDGGVEARGDPVQPLGPHRDHPFERVARPVVDARQPLAGAGEPQGRRVADQSLQHAVEPPLRGARRRRQGRAQPRLREVEALALHRQQRLRARDHPGEPAQVAAAAVDQPGERPGVAPREVVEVGQEVEAHRHRHLGRARRRGRAPVGGMVDQRHVGLVADRGNERDRALGGGPHHDLLVEAPQILDRAAAAGDDQHVRPRDRPVGRQRVEAADRGRDLLGRALALHAHRPDKHRAGKAVLQPVEDVADHRAGRRGHDADDPRQVGQRALAGGIEQALRGELPAALLQERHPGALPGRLQRVDDDLVGGFARKGGDAPGRHHLQPLLGPVAQPPERALPDHRVDLRPAVLEREIGVARAVRAAIARDLAAQPHVSERILQRALEGGGEVGDRPFRRIRGRRGGGEERRGHATRLPGCGTSRKAGTAPAC